MKQKNRFWNIFIAVCLVLLTGAGVCELLFFSEKPATVIVDSVSPAGAAATEDAPSDEQRGIPSATGADPGTEPLLTTTETKPAGTVTDLNAASAEDLKRVSGIGDVLAERIIAYREKNGGFTRRAQLQEIKGIGEKTAAHIMEEFYSPDELPPETAADQTTAERRTTAAGSQTARTSAAKTTAAETVTETEPVLPPKRNINTVTAEELLEIPGMNETRAASIIKVREQIGGYHDLHELTYCEGLSGEYIVNTLFAYLYLEGEEGSAEP